MSKPIKIVALLTARPDRLEELRSLLENMIGPSRAEQGNLRYDLWQDQTTPLRFVLDELYVDEAAVAAHRLTPHFKHYLTVINELADRIAVVLEPIRAD